jgi:hypothetical protein
MPGSSARCAEQEAQMIEAKAVRIVGKGDVDVLRLGTLPIAEPGPSEMLVRIAAAGLNRAEASIRPRLAWCRMCQGSNTRDMSRVSAKAFGRLLPVMP